MADILLIDDMPTVRRAIAAVLTAAGHAVEHAGNGADGIAAARARRFDLVLTDMLMPGTDGVSVVMALAGDPSGPKVVAMSGGSGAMHSDDALRLAALRADATLAKPFDNAELLSVVARLTGAGAPPGGRA